MVTLRSKSGNLDARVFDYFDVVASIGIGGVFAIMLFATHNVSHLLFHAPPSHLMGGGSGETTTKTKAMERVMKEAFEDRLMLMPCNTVKPVLIPCYDLQSSASLIFSRADDLESKNFNF
ncbi:hypothetical protein C4D60_Mb07t19610 [Musa balbisiana]|uniref:Uncharacterized protein n=1 Tax=Musa balbisiana TaxID=52838 RepID=A0A4S8JHS3_MUSBA|nr:hypothetical protein C4D60_Mb07t19610 [Musa balbisiana]